MCVYVCMYIRTYVRTYVCMYVCMHVCMHVCMYVYREIYETENHADLLKLPHPRVNHDVKARGRAAKLPDCCLQQVAT